MPVLDLSGMNQVILWMFIAAVPYAVITNLYNMIVDSLLNMMFGKVKWFK